MQAPAGSRPPEGTAAQVPALPGRLHEKQLAVQFVPQQTPCEQNPDAHSLAFEQIAPLGFLPHEPS